MKLAASLAGWRRMFRSSRAPGGSDPGGRAVVHAMVNGSVSRTHVGRIRAINEDRLLECPQDGFWAVADGMGGHTAGDVAAEAVIAGLQQLASSGGPVTVATVTAALELINTELRQNAADGVAVSGATVVVLFLDGQCATILWVGDCRAYRVRDKCLHQLTRDHSLVQELVDSGTLTPDQADGHPQSHVVTRALGAADSLVVDHVTVEFRASDTFLLSSDGLGRAGRNLASIMTRHDGLDEIAEALLAQALGDDGRDNISLILVRTDARA